MDARFVLRLRYSTVSVCPNARSDNANAVAVALAITIQLLQSWRLSEAQIQYSLAERSADGCKNATRALKRFVAIP